MKSLGFLTGVVLLSATFAQGADSILEGQHTEPSKHPKLSFAAPGLIRAIPVKRGQVVKAGDILLQEDDRQEQAALEALRGEATSGLNIKYYEADYAEKAHKYERLKNLLEKEHAASPSEVWAFFVVSAQSRSRPAFMLMGASS